MNKALWVIQVLVGLLFIFAGGSKLVMGADQMQQMQAGQTVTFSLGFLRFIGVCELLGGLGLILPGLLRIQPGAHVAGRGRAYRHHDRRDSGHAEERHVRPGGDPPGGGRALRVHRLRALESGAAPRLSAAAPRREAIDGQEDRDRRWRHRRRRARLRGDAAGHVPRGAHGHGEGAAGQDLPADPGLPCLERLVAVGADGPGHEADVRRRAERRRRGVRVGRRQECRQGPDADRRGRAALAGGGAARLREAVRGPQRGPSSRSPPPGTAPR